MGEIKSTLDLVLEKTRGLTLSREEKLDLARQELEKKVHGLINRYLDHLIPLSRLKEEMADIDSEGHGLASRLLTGYLLACFDLDRDNSSILSALSEIAGFDTGPLAAVQKEYESAREDSGRAFKEKILLGLEERGVSGSAVVAHLDQNPEWNRFHKGLRKRYSERIKATGMAKRGSKKVHKNGGPSQGMPK